MTKHDWNGLRGGLPARGFNRIEDTDDGAERWRQRPRGGPSLTLLPGLDHWKLAGEGLGPEWLPFTTLEKLDEWLIDWPATALREAAARAAARRAARSQSTDRTRTNGPDRRPAVLRERR